MKTCAVIAEHLTKVYPAHQAGGAGKRALNNVDFAIEEGQVFGFLGPNGAGKTTAVKVLNGMLRITEGSCRVLGIDPGSAPEQVHALSGVVTEHAQMYNNLTGLENLVFFGTVFGLGADESRSGALDLLERLDLLDAKDKKLAAYSTGMRQRLSLARAMIHHPKILFLDEPTSGLDPESALSVNNMIKSLAKEKGTTVFLCTHQLRYAEEICTSYGLISEGSMLAAGSLDELRSLVFSGMTVTLRADSFPQALKSHQGFAAQNEGEVCVDVNTQEEIPLLIKQIVDSGGKVYHVSARRLSLEEIYFALIERRKKDGLQNA